MVDAYDVDRRSNMLVKISGKQSLLTPTTRLFYTPSLQKVLPQSVTVVEAFAFSTVSLHQLSRQTFMIYFRVSLNAKERKTDKLK